MSDHKPTEELSAEELNEVSGGVKKIDKSSPKLFSACASGEHISAELVPMLPTQELSNSALDDVVGGAAATGKHISKGKLTLRKAGGDQQEFI
jgi:bacteriocin-like protein